MPHSARLPSCHFQKTPAPVHGAPPRVQPTSERAMSAVQCTKRREGPEFLWTPLQCTPPLEWRREKRKGGAQADRAGRPAAARQWSSVQDSRLLGFNLSVWRPAARCSANRHRCSPASRRSQSTRPGTPGTRGREAPPSPHFRHCRTPGKRIHSPSVTPH